MSSEQAGVTEEQAREVRREVHRVFGAVSVAMMTVPRYRDLSLGDIRLHLFEPLIRNRVSVAYGKGATATAGDIIGVAIWASVSEEVDARIREEIAGRVYPLRVEPEEWTSGTTNWLLDIIAPDQAVATAMLKNFRDVVQGGNLHIHPGVASQIGAEVLEEFGLRRD